MFFCIALTGTSGDKYNFLRTVVEGYPRGPSQDPLLFCMDMNDLSDRRPGVSRQMHADDRMIYTYWKRSGKDVWSPLCRRHHLKLHLW